MILFGKRKVILDQKIFKKYVPVAYHSTFFKEQLVFPLCFYFLGLFLGCLMRQSPLVSSAVKVKLNVKPLCHFVCVNWHKVSFLPRHKPFFYFSLFRVVWHTYSEYYSDWISFSF